jgi:hypothetical protein
VKLVFGVNPFDRCPGTKARYHVVDETGYIVSKSDYGFSAYDHAGNLSAREPGTFSVIDTRDGSVYGAWRSGKPAEEEAKPEVCAACHGKGFVKPDGAPVNAFDASDSDAVIPCAQCHPEVSA